MIPERFPEILQMSLDDRMTLYCELRDLLVEQLGPFEPEPEIVAELERRHQEYLRDPSSARPWPEVQRRLRERYLSAARE